jgi:hypothetical protein
VGLTGQFPFRLAQTLPDDENRFFGRFPRRCSSVRRRSVRQFRPLPFPSLPFPSLPFPSATLAAPYAYTVPEAEGRQVL